MAENVSEFVARLVEDPAKPPDLTLLNGYLGSSGDDNVVRIYRSVELNAWFDIPIEQIRFRMTLEPYATCPLGEHLVWMLREQADDLELHTSVVGASQPTPHPQLAGQPRPGTASGTVVNINLGGGGAVSTGPESDDGPPAGGGHHHGPTQLYPR
jgi:hypothetical protein